MINLAPDRVVSFSGFIDGNVGAVRDRKTFVARHEHQ